MTESAGEAAGRLRARDRKALCDQGWSLLKAKGMGVRGIALDGLTGLRRGEAWHEHGGVHSQGAAQGREGVLRVPGEAEDGGLAPKECAPHLLESAELSGAPGEACCLACHRIINRDEVPEDHTHRRVYGTESINLPVDGAARGTAVVRSTLSRTPQILVDTRTLRLSQK